MAGMEPVALIDLHIADLLPPEPKPTREDTSAYRLDDWDIRKSTRTIVETLRKTVPDLEVPYHLGSDLMNSG